MARRCTSSRSPTWKRSWATAGNSNRSRRCSARAARTASRDGCGTAPPARSTRSRPKAWEPYDIRLKLERNWATLGPKLAGKLHVYMGDVDTFYLDGAARLLQKSLRDLGSDAVVEMFPDRDHGTIGLRRPRARPQGDGGGVSEVG